MAFIGQIVFFFLVPLWLNDSNENKNICLFCAMLAILFFTTNVTINVNYFFS